MMGIGLDKEEVLTEKISKQIKESKTSDMKVGKKKKNKKHTVSDGDTEYKSVDVDENGENARNKNERKKKKERKLTVGEESKEEKQDIVGDEDNEKDIDHDKKKRKLADDEYENKDEDSPVKKKSKKQKKGDRETGAEILVENIEKKKKKMKIDESHTENPNLETDEKDIGEMREEKARKKKKKSKKEKKEDGENGEENLIENFEKKKKEKKTEESDYENPRSKTDENYTLEIREENVRKKKKKDKKTDESNSEDPQLKTDENDTGETSKKNVGKKKRKKEKKTDESDSENPKLKTDENVKKKKKKEKKTDEKDSENPKSKPRKPKKVSFSSTIEVFPFEEEEEKKDDDNLIRGKRFTPEEDKIVKEAVQNYINTSNLGEEGLEKVLNCRSHPEVRHCWKEIASAIPYRPQSAVYYRAHILFERGEKRKWTQEEYDFVKEAHKKHGSNWKLIADEMGKHRFHVKDTWRRIKHENLLKGQWNQHEYQTLFDLVNTDLELKVKEEKKSKHGMLRDNICWEAISEKLSTRSNPACCMKWYDQLSSPMVKSGIWADVDDYKLLDGLYGQDACCTEDVNWDELVEGRPGEVCKKRWDQMVMHIGQHRLKTFGEQVDTLAKRYCPNLIEARQEWESKPYVD